MRGRKFKNKEQKLTIAEIWVIIKLAFIRRKLATKEKKLRIIRRKSKNKKQQLRFTKLNLSHGVWASS